MSAEAKKEMFTVWAEHQFRIEAACHFDAAEKAKKALRIMLISNADADAFKITVSREEE
jgi:hypothetical protein